MTNIIQTKIHAMLYLVFAYFNMFLEEVQGLKANLTTATVMQVYTGDSLSAPHVLTWVVERAECTPTM